MIKPGTRRPQEPRRAENQRASRPAVASGENQARAGGPRRPPPHQRPHGRPGRQPPKKAEDRPPPPKPKAKPRPQAPITQAMIEGKAPLRTFGDLQQLWKLKQQETAEEERATE